MAALTIEVDMDTYEKVKDSNLIVIHTENKPSILIHLTNKKEEENGRKNTHNGGKRHR